jgi:probable F420-dependent oxidoreductase
VQVELGEIGVWTTYRALGEENAGEAARLVEELGYGVFWLGGSPRLPSVRPLLEATESLVVATGIVNVWTYDPAQLATEYATLARDFPERLLVGIGIGHPEAASDYSRPLSAMRAFLDGLDGVDPPLPRDRRCLAALAPKMLALSAERSIGAIPYFVPVAHTSFARAQLGPGPLLAPEVAFVLDEDPDRARDKAREYARTYLGLSNYTNNLLRLGFTDEDIADGGSDRLIDAVIPHGSADEIATAVRAHLDAGANHVPLQAIGEPGIPRQGWTALAAIRGL